MSTLPKQSIGKIKLPSDFFSKVEDLGFSILSITKNHISTLNSISMIHRDPFDRMLIAQAISDGLALVTKDSDILRYPDVNLIEV